MPPEMHKVSNFLWLFQQRQQKVPSITYKLGPSRNRQGKAQDTPAHGKQQSENRIFCVSQPFVNLIALCCSAAPSHDPSSTGRIR